MNMVLFGLAYF